MVELILAPVLGGASAALLTLSIRERRSQKALRRQLRHIATTEGVAPIAQESVLREEPGSRPESTWAQKLVHRVPRLSRLQLWLSSTGVSWGVLQFLAISLCFAGALGLLANMLLGMPAVTVAAVVGGGLLPAAMAGRKRAKRVELFTQQFPDALEMLVRAIRVGHPVSTAMRMVAEEAPEPIASEFRRVAEEQRFGVAFEKSMAALAARIGTTEARIAVAGIVLQRQVGGNLPEFVERVISMIRERIALLRQVQAQTSQGRMSGMVLTLLPVAMGGIITLVSPSYLGAMFESQIGRSLMGASAVLLLLGHVWIQRIVKLKE